MWNGIKMDLGLIGVTIDTVLCTVEHMVLTREEIDTLVKNMMRVLDISLTMLDSKWQSTSSN